MERNDFHEIAKIRVKEAKVLLDNGFYSGADYLLGYALECGLKSCIAKQFKKYEFPDKKLVIDSYTHDLERLLNISGLKQKFDTASKNDPEIDTNWSVVKDWSENKRYEFNIGETEVGDLYKAVTDQKSGILAWIMKYW